MDEIWGLCDKDGNPTTMKVKRFEKIPEGYYHKIVHLCIINSAGKLLSQQRSASKFAFPLYWDITVGGSSILDENENQAITRELKEELGLDIDFTNISPIFLIKGINYLDYWFFIKCDVDLNQLTLQKDEVIDVAYYTIEEIEELISKDRFVDYLYSDMIKKVISLMFE
ncbi:MAG: NUDIX hydrolase [Erysipelotrichaceae bacterium]|jgi:isopentenyldiphosphate isomerase